MNKKFNHLRKYKDLMNSDDQKNFSSNLGLQEIIENWSYFSDDENLKLFLHLDTEKKVDLLNELSNMEQEKIIGALSTKNIKELFAEMEPDDLVDIIQSVSPDVRKSTWENMSDEAKKETLFLLRFDEDDAAGLMTPRYLALRSSIKVSQALKFIRHQSSFVETVYYIYIVDQLKRLIGVVSIKNLLAADDETLISDIMENEVISVREDTDQEEVAHILERHDLFSLPVTDQNNILLGIITFDDIIDVIREEQTEDVYKMGAMDGQPDIYLETSVWRLIRKRVIWLIILLIVGTITTNVLDHYRTFIISAAFLAIFMPVIIQTGGNSGNQSTTLMIRGLATGEIKFRDIGKILLKEIAIGLIMGIITGIVIILRSYFLPPGVEFNEALAIGVSLIFVVLFSTIIGALAPLIIHKMGFDPTVMSGPLMATVIDVCGLTIYFQIAGLILQI